MRCRLALHVQILLKIDHVDVAERDLKNTSKIDDNATLAQITTAWVGVVVDPFATHCAGHAHMLYAKLALGNLVACARWAIARSRGAV